ncbi:MAG: hypothetical protein AAGD13_00555 [Pseudomonadota bacterium]
MDHKLEIDPVPVRALLMGEASAVVVKDAAGAIQRSDRVTLAELPADGLDLGDPPSFWTVRRVTPGTGPKGNGIVPGFAVLELGAGDAVIEHRLIETAEIGD